MYKYIITDIIKLANANLEEIMVNVKTMYFFLNFYNILDHMRVGVLSLNKSEPKLYAPRIPLARQ